MEENAVSLTSIAKFHKIPAKNFRRQYRDHISDFHDWDQKEQVWEKVEEELREFREEFQIESDVPVNQNNAESEFGDLLFSLINYARFVDINPEDALERTNKKFIRRFSFLEEEARKSGRPLAEMTLTEMDVFWEKAKKLE